MNARQHYTRELVAEARMLPDSIGSQETFMDLCFLDRLIRERNCAVIGPSPGMRNFALLEQDSALMLRCFKRDQFNESDGSMTWRRYVSGIGGDPLNPTVMVQLDMHCGPDPAHDIRTKHITHGMQEFVSLPSHLRRQAS